ncbi:alpha/beta fold hydrolase [Nesterenkonia populi]|uniref:alpha/beta fold hydrolase n=1 Tax=Nesterenkonia populi TaxID=1591087 RepID=UPI0011BEB25E|nr:alpha/beta hydrolase [Nesterenkonia populi]
MSEAAVNTRFLGLKDVKVHVGDTGGTGRPVVLIHGWPLNADSWAEQKPALAQAGYRVVSYDRRGFGRSDKPGGGYDYDTLADDLAGLLEELDLRDVTLVGFSMGGGEVARYIARHGQERLHSVVFAGAVTPMMMKSEDNPDGPLDEATAQEMSSQLEADPEAFFDQFTREFFSAAGTTEPLVSEDVRQQAIEQSRQADKSAALKAMEAFGTSDFREDLKAITVPTLVLHGSADATVPFEGSGQRTHAAVPHSQLRVIDGAPHGFNASHAEEFNSALTQFLSE